MKKYCIGIDYGTDSVRALLINTLNGEELASSVFEYPRWKKKLYCDPEKNNSSNICKIILMGLK
jgi:L-ribulokinase